MEKASQSRRLFSVLFALLPEGTAVAAVTDLHDCPEQFVLVDGLVFGQFETVFHRVDVQLTLWEFFVWKAEGSLNFLKANYLISIYRQHNLPE